MPKRRRPLPRRLRRALDAFLAACIGRACEKLARGVAAPRAVSNPASVVVVHAPQNEGRGR